MEPIHGGPLAGRTVLVTGGTGGIGKATAMALASHGARVAITGRDRDRTEAAAGAISAQSEVADRSPATSRPPQHGCGGSAPT